MIYLNEKEEIFKTHDRGNLPKNLLFDDKESIPSGTLANSMANTNPEFINIQHLNNIANQANLCKLYQDFVKSVYNDCLKDFYGKIQSGHYKINMQIPGQISNPEVFNNMNSIVNVMSNDIDTLKLKGLSTLQIMDIITKGYIPESLNEKECRAAINLILSNSKIMVNILTNCLRSNYKSLNLSLQEAEMIIDELNDDSATHEGMAKIKEIMENPKILKKFRLGSFNYDFRSIGGGCMFLSSTPNVQVSHKPSKKLNLIFRYDAVVMAHGGYEDITPDKNPDLPNMLAEIKKHADSILKFNSIVDPKNWKGDFEDLSKNINKLKCDNRSIKYLAKINSRLRGIKFKLSDQNELNNFNSIMPSLLSLLSKTINSFKKQQDPDSWNRDGNSKNWTCEPISTLKHSNMTSIVDVLRALKSEGFKNVYIGSCNPNSIKIPDDLRNDKNFKYTVAKYDAYLESCSQEDDINEYINEINQLCNTIQIELINEGRVSDFIKKSIKKVIELCKKLWSRLIEFLRSSWHNLNDKLNKLLKLPNSKKHLDKPIEINYISVDSSSAKQAKLKSSSIDEIKKNIDIANKSLSDTILKYQQQSERALHNAESRLNSINLKEFGIFSECVFI